MSMPLTGPAVRRGLKRALAATEGPSGSGPAAGATLLIYHRIGGGTPDERDLPTAEFEAQVEELTRHEVVSLDDALDALEAGDRSPKVVLTFDDGFEDVHRSAWPLLREAQLPFTLYLTTAYLDGTMHWPGSTSQHPGPGLRWAQVEELAESPLVTIGNHTHTHVPPDRLDAEELDVCSQQIERRLGIVPRHFCFTWGVSAPAARPLLEARFRSAATGRPGRNLPGQDLYDLARVPVRGTDPFGFFRAKLTGELTAERRYERIVQAAKLAGISG